MTTDFKQALRAGLLAFAGIAGGGFVLIAAWAPTTSPNTKDEIGNGTQATE